MSAVSMPEVKDAVRQMTVAETEALVARVRDLATAAEVRAVVSDYMFGLSASSQGFGVKAWILAAVLLISAVAHAGDPTRTWRTVETAHFVIYYWAPLDDVARRVGVVAERAHRTLSPALDHAPTTKTLIFLADDTDSANGFATALPRNAIQLYATGPSGFSELDDHDGSACTALSPTSTRTSFTSTRWEGPPTIYNGIFGKTWAPNQIMPRWVIEGIAVYEESKQLGPAGATAARCSIRTSGSRAIRTRTCGMLDEVSGNPRQFPRGNAAYVYGSHFLRYVFDRFGDDKLREIACTSPVHSRRRSRSTARSRKSSASRSPSSTRTGAYLRDHYGKRGDGRRAPQARGRAGR